MEQPPPIDTVTARRRWPIPWLEIIPLLIFFFAFQWVNRTRPNEALLIAAAIFAGAALIAMMFGIWKEKRVSKILLASTAAIVGSAALAFLFDDTRFFLVRPTVINGGIALILLGSLALRRNAARSVLGKTLQLPEKSWTQLSLRFGLFFLMITLINEFVWRTQTEAVWVTVKTFGFAPLTALMMVVHIPFVRRHGKAQRKLSLP